MRYRGVVKPRGLIFRGVFDVKGRCVVAGCEPIISALKNESQLDHQ